MNGFAPEPEKIACTPGVVFAIGALIRAMTKEGDGVLICQPVYYPFENSIRHNNRKLVVSNLINNQGYYTYDYEDIERKIVENNVKLFIQCSPHNPVGRVWKREELVKIGNICLKHGVFVISDEIHSDYVFGDNGHTVFASLGGGIKENCAVCTSPSKSFNLAGLQISNIYIPNPSVMEKFESQLDIIGYHDPNVMGVTACQAAYTKGGEWFLALKEYLRQNMYFVRDYLKENIPSIKFYMPEGTYLIWLDCSGLGLSDKDLTKLFEEKAGLWMDDGYIFGSAGSGYERFNVACPRQVLKTALDKLKCAINNII